MKRNLQPIFIFLSLLSFNLKAQTPVQAPVITYASPQSYVAGTAIAPLLPVNTGGAVPAGVYAQTTTVKAGFGYIYCTVADTAGNIYFGDNDNHVIRKITPAGLASIFAGSGVAGTANGTGTAASFSTIRGLAIDASGTIYVADADNNLIRKISPYGVVTTFAGKGTAGAVNGTAANATFNYPSGVAVDAAGNVFVTENYNNDIRKITAAGIVSTLAGNVGGGYLDGQGVAASFNVPQGITIDAAGNLYISDTNNFLIRKVTAAGVVTTFAGAAGNPGLTDGTGAAASFYYPQGIAIDAAGNLYVADSFNSLIRKITPAKQVTTLAGKTAGTIDGIGTSAAFNGPQGLAIDKSGNLYVADYSAVRKISLAGYSAPVLPPGLTFDPATGSITGTPLLAKAATNYSVIAYNAGGSTTANISITVTGAITPPVNPVAAPHISYATPQSYAAGTVITALKPGNSGGAVPGGYYGQVLTLTTGFGDSRAIVTDTAHNIYYGDNNLIRKVTLAGVSSIFAGSTNAGYANGTGTAARFSGIQGLAIDASGNIYVADAHNNLLRTITPAGVVTTFVGSGIAGRNDGAGAAASFNNPANIVIDRYGNLFVADLSNNIIRKITPAGIVSTFAGNGLQKSTDGTGTGASFYHPQGITIDGLGNLYVAETENSVIRKITTAGVVTTFAGTPGNTGFVNGTGTGASFFYPSSLSIDLSGNIFVADLYNYAIRKITPAGVVTTVAGGNSGIVDGTGTAAGFGSPQALVVDGLGNLLVCDGAAIRKVAVTGYVAPTLPAGLTFDPSNGSISGTPLVAKAATSYSVTAYNTGGSNTAIVSITVTGTITAPVNPVAAPHIAYATPQSYVAGVAISSLTPTNSGGAVPAGFYGQTSTLVNGLGNATAIVMDAAKNIYYGESYLIRKITPAGVSSIFAGSGNAGSANGSGTAASFNGIQGLAIDAAGNIYATERANNLVRKITPLGVVTTLAGSGSAGRNDGPGTTASFNGPAAIVADAYGNLYLSDFYNNLVRKITPAGVVTTFAGSGVQVTADGTGTNSSFIHPQGMAIDGAGNLYVSETENSVIRKITPAGVVSTFAGSPGTTGFSDGTGTAASFYYPAGLSVDVSGNIYVGDIYNYAVRKITPAAVVTTLAGGSSSSLDGVGTAAGFTGPQGIATDGLGNVFVTDNGAIRKVLATGYVIPVLPTGLTFDPATGAISGTPLTAKAATNYAVTAYNTGGSNTATVSIAVTGTPAAPAAISAPVISYAGPKTYPTGAAIASLAPTNTGGAVPATIYGQTSTFAGSGVTGQTNGSSAMATFNSPSAVAADVYGNTYVADRGNHIIRKISANGIVTTLAGSGTAGYADGTGSAASFYYPSGIAVDVLGNVYVTDTYNQVIRKITPAGVVTTLAGTAGNIGSADGTGANAAFNYPTGITIDASKNLYITDENNYTIRKITSAGVVTTLAGSAGSAGSDNGTGGAATFNAPAGITVDASGNLYVADFGNSQIRKVTSAGVVTTFAGGTTAGFVDGTGAAAGFYNPKGITIDKAANLYVTDAGNNLIRKITSAKVVSTLAGNNLPNLVNGIGTASSFNSPWGITIDVKGSIYIAEANNNVVRKITATGYTIDNSLPAGLIFNGATGIIGGTPTAPLAATVYTITAYNGGGSGSAAVTITATGNAVAKTLISPPQISYGAAKSYIAGTAIASLTPTNIGGAVPPAIYGQTTTLNAPIGYSTGMAADGAGNTYISSNNQVIKVNAAGVASIFAGNTTAGSANGKGTAASFSDPEGLAVDVSGNLYVADAGNNQVRKITPSGVVTTFAGNLTAGTTNGSLTAARFNSPVGLAFDASGNLYVADVNNYLIRKITAAGVVSNFAGSGAYGYTDGSGSAASFSNVYGMVTDASGNVYLTDRGNQVIRKITPAGLVSTLAGTAGNIGAVDGTGSAANFYNPHGLAIDAAGNLYVADQANMLVRKITPAGVVTTLAGNGTGTAVDGVGTNASFYSPSLIAADGLGNLYVAEYYNNILRKISITGYKLDGTLPAGLTFDGITGTISGTPLLKIAATNYSVTAYNAGGSSTTPVNIAVTGTIIPPVNPVQAPVITYATPQSYIAGTAITALLPANTGGAVPASAYGQTSTIATGLYSDNLVADASGNIYTTLNNQVIKISPSGVSNVFAGNGTAGFANGAGTAASFNNPQGLAIDAAGNIYVADYNNNSVRRITSAGVVTTLAGSGLAGRADGPGTISSFNGPQAVAVDNYGNVYITEVGNNLVRKINSSGLVSTLAGSGSGGYADGTGNAASFSNPHGIVDDALGNLYVTDENNALIRKITPDGVVSTFAGTANNTGAVNGTGTAASFSNPSGISIDAAGNLYVADQHNMLIRKITPVAVVTTLAGTGSQGTVDGIATNASFYYPSAAAVDGFGNLYVNDPYYGNVRKISIAGYNVNGTLPAGLTFDGTTGAISGTPLLAAAASSYTVTAYNAGGSSTAILSIAVTGALTPPVNPVQAPVISYATPQSYAAGVNITALLPTNTGGAVPAATYGQTSSISHGLPYINGIIADAAGNIYGAGDNQILKTTPAGVTSLFAGSSTAGSANGDGTAARFNNPQGLAIDAAGNIYVADYNNNQVRKITPAGMVTTLAGNGQAGRVDGPAASADFLGPQGLAADNYGNIYVTENGNNLVRKISSSGIVSTMAGSGLASSADGTGTAASFNNPFGIVADGSGNLYVAEQGGHVIRKITPAGVVTTFAGTAGTAGANNGTGAAAAFNAPSGLAIDAAGNLYVADQNNMLIRKISPAKVVTTLAGNGSPYPADGVGTSSSFYYPSVIAADASGSVYVNDHYNNGIRKISITGFTLTGTLPAGLTFDSTTGTISGTPLLAAAAKSYSITGYNAGGGSTAALSIAVTGTAVAPTLATLPVISYATPKTYGVGIPIAPLQPANTGGAVPAGTYGLTSTLAGSGATGRADGSGVMASFSGMSGTATDIYGNVYVADNVNNVIRKITPGGIVTTLAGSGAAGAVNGTGAAASFNNPVGITVDKSSNVFVADATNNMIRKITPSGVVTTFAGSGAYGLVNGTGVNASFSNPQGIAVDKSGNVYVADTYNYVIRKITSAGVVTTLAGSGGYGAANGTKTAASFGAVYNLAVDGSGNIYAADINNYIVRKITTAGVVTTLAGNGTTGFADGAGVKASFSSNFFLTADAGNNIYVGDAGNNLIRKINTTGLVSTVAGNGGAALINGIGSNASFKSPGNLAIDNNGNLFVADAGNNVIRKVMVAGYTLNMPPPPGLTFEGATGIFSGTPSGPFPATAYTVSAYNSAGAATANVNITVVYPPVVTTSAPVTAFASMGDIPPVPVVIDNAISVTDLSKATLASATVAVTGNLVPAQDLLGFNANGASMGNIAGVYNSATGILSLSSAGATATLLQWQAALAAVTYNNSNNVSPATTSRTVSFTLNDGLVTGFAANKTISLAYTPSSNANLSALTINTATLSPVFAQGTIAYTANVKNTVSSVTVKPITASGNATVTVNGKLVTSGSNSAAVPLSVGVNTISVVVKAQDLATTKTYKISLTRAAAQTITFAALSAQKYGTANFSVAGSSTNNTIPVTYTSSNTAVATITSSGTLHIVSVGTTNITASQAGNVNYDPAPPVTQAITITAAALTVTAGNQTKSYGAANPALSFTYSGFVNGETAAVISTQPSISTTATASSPAGTYPITASGAVAANYTISYIAGTLTVTAPPLVFSAIPAKKYGTTDFDAGAASTAAITYTSGTPTVATIVAGKIHIVKTGTSVITATDGTTTLTQTLTVSKAALKITAVNKTKIYGAANPALTLTYTGFVNGETQTKLSTQAAIKTTATAASPVGTYPITASGAAATNYTITYTAGTMTVGKAALTITANNQTKNYGDAIPKLTATYSGFVNGDTTVTTLPAITTTATASSPAGTYPITASGAVAANYTISYVAGTLTVTAPPLVFSAIPAKKYGTTDFDAGAASTAAITYTSGTPTVATIVAGKIHIVKTGTSVITATDGTTTLTQTLTVSKAALKITAVNKTKTYGVANPALTLTYTGFVNGETQTKLSTQAAIKTTATAASPVGTYPITASGAAATNYTITYTAGTMTVGKAALTITANNQTKNYGDAIPKLTATYSGFVNGDTTVTTLPAITTTATASSPAGTYPITASGAVAANYTISYVAGTLTVTAPPLVFSAIPAKKYGTTDFDAGAASTAAITYTSGTPTVATIVAGKIHIVKTGTSVITATDGTTTLTQTLTVSKAALKITAVNKTKTYGVANPALTLTYTGFVNGETQTKLSTQAAIKTTATAASPVGTYPITASGAAATNYTITYTAGTMTVGKAALTITANNQTKNYGDAIPKLTATYSGFVNGDTTVTTLPAITTTATASSPAGTYPITASGAVAANYTISYVAGTLTVTAPPLVFSAIPAKKYGTTDFDAGAASTAAITYTSGTPTVATIVAGKIHIVKTGTSVITATDGTTTLTQTLTVSKAALKITAVNKTKTYGVANPALTLTYTGFVNGETQTKLSTQAAIKTTATAASPVGTYPITASGAAATNYTITYTAGTMTVGKAALTITANNQTKNYGAAIPKLTATYSGFVNGDTTVTTLPAITTTATASSPAGTYPITASGAVAANYTISYIAGTLTVTAPPLVFSAIPAKKYGTTDFDAGAASTAAITYTSGTPTVATIVAGKIHIVKTGTSVITATDGTTTLTQTLTVSKAALKITAVNKTKTYGAANPALTVSYTGFVNGETQTALTTLPSVTTTAITSSAAGSYPITASGAVAANYSFTYVAGTLTIILPLQAPAIAYSSPQTYTVGTAIAALNPSNTGGAVPATTYGQVSTFAGSGVAGAVNGTGTAASFTSPEGLAIDKSGNIYVADDGSGLIRKITSAGVVTSVANGTVFPDPNGVAVDASGNLYVPDDEHALIKKITTAGVITTFAGSGSFGLVDGTGTAASFETPYGITNDDAGNLYVADVGSNAIRKITTAGVVTTLAGTGAAGFVNATGKSASFNIPLAAAADHLGNIYVADLQNNVIRKITSAGVVTTFAGSGLRGGTDGPGTSANFQSPYGLTTDTQNNVYVADAGGNTVRKITAAGVVTTVAGNGTAGAANGIGAAASFSFPAGLIFDAAGNLYVADLNNNLIRKISMTGYSISPALPKGLVFNNTTGRITGTPSSITPSANYTITAYNVAGSSTTTINIGVKSNINMPAISYAGPQNYTTGVAIASLTPTNTGGAVPAKIYGQVTTFAGSGAGGKLNGTGLAASFNVPKAIVEDATGNLYVADAGNYLIRKITPAGVVSIFAGNGVKGIVNGTGAAAGFVDPVSMAIDAAGNIFVAEPEGNVIRKITPGGVVTTFAGSGTAGAVNGIGTAASFKRPLGVVTDVAGNIYVADGNNFLIRKITPAGVVTTLAGNGTFVSQNGTGTSAGFSSTSSITADAAGNVYVGENGSNTIRKITPAGVVTTFAGSGDYGSADGPGNAATFSNISGLAADVFGNIYVADNNLIRAINITGTVTTIAGNAAQGSVNGTGASATFTSPYGLTVDAGGIMYVADTYNHLIRKVNLTGFGVSPALPAGLSIDGTTGIISGTPSIITPATTYKIVAFNAGGGSTAYLNIAINAPAIAKAPSIHYAGPQTYVLGQLVASLSPVNTGGAVPPGIFGQTSTFAAFYNPAAVAVDTTGNLYVADAGNNLVRKISSAGVITTFAGSGSAGFVNGTGTAASFNYPDGIAVNKLGDIYVAEQANNVIRKITAAGVVTTFAGSTAGAVNGTGTAAKFNQPANIAIDGSGNLFVADKSNNMIRKITAAGVVTTFAGSATAGSVNGTGTAARFNSPSGVAVDRSGNVYVADKANNLVRKITPGGIVTTLAGNGTAGTVDGFGTNASFNGPAGLTVDKTGNIYVADAGNQLIRKITPAGIVTSVAGMFVDVNGDGVNDLQVFQTPASLANDIFGNLYVSDPGNSKIVKTNLNGYSVNPALPAGLNLDSTTGIISGKPSVIVPPSTYTITATNGAGTGSDTLTIRINSASVAAPAIAYSGPKSYAKGSAIAPLTPTNTGGAIPAIPAQVVSAFAGSGLVGSVNGTGTAASFNNYYGYGNVATDAGGNIYVADAGNYIVRKITPAGVVTTLAGSGTPGMANGTGTSASFSDLKAITVDPSGNVYVSDFNIIRKITPAGVVTTFAGGGPGTSTDGTGTAASFYFGIFSLASDAAGNIYVAEPNDGKIRKITPAGVVTTIVSDENNNALRLLFGLTVDSSGNLYGACSYANVIIKVTQAGVISTIAGTLNVPGSANGTGTAATFNAPYGIINDASGNLYVADAANNLIRKITSAGVVTTLAGNMTQGLINSTVTTSNFNFPNSIALDAAGNTYIFDSGSNMIRKIGTTGFTISPALPAGLVINANTGVISGTPTATSAAKNYTITAYNNGGTSVATVSIAVTNSFAFAAIAAKKYGTADFSPGATGTGTISYSSSNTAVATIVSSKIHIKGVGTSVISAVNNGVTLTQTLTVSKAPLTITAKNQTKVAGAANPLLTVTYSGFVYSDTSSVVTTAPTVTTTAVTASPAGNYPITVSGAVAANYSITYVAGVLSVTVTSLASYEPVSTNNVAMGQAKGLQQQPEVKQGMSPNGDGIADVLIIDNISSYPDNKLMLMNRSGVKIYEVSGYDNLTKAFDGHSGNNGKMQPAGTYFYVLEYRDKGELKRKTGYFIMKY